MTNYSMTDNYIRLYVAEDEENRLLEESMEQEDVEWFRGEGVTLLKKSYQIRKSPVEDIIFDLDNADYQILRVEFIHSVENEQGNLTSFPTYKDFFRGQTDLAYDYAKQVRGIIIPARIGEFIKEQVI